MTSDPPNSGAEDRRESAATINIIASLSSKTGDLIFFLCVRESHLTTIPQAEPEPAQAYEHFSFGKPRPRKAELYRRLSGRAEPAQHYLYIYNLVTVWFISMLPKEKEDTQIEYETPPRLLAFSSATEYYFLVVLRYILCRR